MRIEYSKRALQDLRKVAAEAQAYGPGVAEAVEERLRHLIDHLRREPNGAPRIEERPGVRVIPLIKYPYKIFYRTTESAVRVLLIRHTSRRPW
jgi:toxin ParE1/3/4